MTSQKFFYRTKKNKRIVIFLIILVLFIFIVNVFGKYVTSSIHDFFLRSKEFYFYSDKLKEEGAE